MKIRTRLIGLLFFLTLFCLSVLTVQKKYEHNRLLQLMDFMQMEREYVFDRILSLKEKPLETFAFDYSFWDEMAEFVAVPDMTWAVENIEVSLATYEANAAWVYTLDSQLVYSVNNLDEPSGFKELPVPASAGSLFTKGPFCHFFVNTSRGLMEIHGAAIFNSDDLKREGIRHGYLFCGRLWSNDYIDELGQLASSVVNLSDFPENKLPALNQDSIYFSRPLKGWDGQIVKYLNISVTSRAVAGLKRSALQVALLFFIFSAVTLVTVTISIFYWINIPLGLIALSLSKEDSGVLKKLKRQNTEFGDISRMVDSFFMQRNTILNEIARRKQTQEALNKVNNCFVSFGTDPDQNLQRITETAGQILGATCMLYNRGYEDELVTKASWHEPPDFSKRGPGHGHICFDLIQNQNSQLVFIEDLQHTAYSKTDPNVKKYNLQSYVGCPVRSKDRTIAMLCGVFDFPVKIDEYYLNLLQVLGKAASIEEDRKQTEEIFRDQAAQLDSALKEALKSREILLSMLEDNQLNKAKLEQSVQELAVAYAKLKQSQEEVVQVAKFGAIGQLASSVAHEVRNPLAIIMQSLDYLKEKVPVQQQDVIQIANNNIKRANTIIGTLLDFSKAKKVNMSGEDINSILDDCLHLTRYGNLRGKIKIITELSQGLPKVWVDRQKIEQVFVNIFLNAMQAMPQGGDLVVRSYLTECSKLPKEITSKIDGKIFSLKDAVTVDVQDEGSGVSEENMKHIFQPFFTTKGEMTGIGLGLSVVKDILTMHNGSIVMDSQPNKGTKVSVTLIAAA